MGMMACYDQAKQIILTVTKDPDPKNPSLQTKLGSAAVAGFCCAFLSLPFDLIKSRLQSMQPDPVTGRVPYKGVVDCAGQILTKEGPLSFWRGFTAYYGRCAPHAMIILLSIEQVTAVYRSTFLDGDEETSRRSLVSAARFTSTGSVPTSATKGEGMKTGWFARYKSGGDADDDLEEEDETDG